VLFQVLTEVAGKPGQTNLGFMWVSAMPDVADNYKNVIFKKPSYKNVNLWSARSFGWMSISTFTTST
jgi:hypothetical protein